MARLNHDLEPNSGQGGGRRPWTLGRVLGAGQDPLTWWSFPLLRLGGLRIRVHTLLVPVWVGIQMLSWLPENKLGAIHVFSGLGALIVLALLHEIGRGLFARWLGDGGDCVVVWPLGGLNSVARRGATHPLAAESGGLVVNILLFPILAVVAMGLQLDRSALVFNPLNPMPVLQNDLGSTEQVLVWWAYYMNAIMLGLNLLVPMLPLDSGRLLNAYLRGSSNTPVETGARIGFVAAGVLFLVGVALGQGHIMGVAVLGGIATVMELRRHQFLLMDEEPEPMPAHEPEEAPARKTPQLVPNNELDAVLEKISREGMESLTTAEREVLARETERRRRG
ncbi:MAG TPA: DUF6576 domain-containing protein [Phycisphaerales bacterium]|nr:DUF6576 domain-containing protein [Phycisphaerales bacterium]